MSEKEKDLQTASMLADFSSLPLRDFLRFDCFSVRVCVPLVRENSLSLALFFLFLFFVFFSRRFYRPERNEVGEEVTLVGTYE